MKTLGRTTRNNGYIVEMTEEEHTLIATLAAIYAGETKDEIFARDSARKEIWQNMEPALKAVWTFIHAGAGINYLRRVVEGYQWQQESNDGHNG